MMNKITDEWKKDKPLYKPVISTNLNKKGMVYILRNGKKRLIYFGQKGYPDFASGTASKEQRKSFRARMKGIKLKDGSFAYKSKLSPAYWSLKILW